MFRKTVRKHKKSKQLLKGFAFEGPSRLSVLVALWCLGLAIVVVRLYKVQVVQQAHFEKTARSYIDYRRTLPAQRGTITDRNGQIMAVDLIHYHLAAKPNLIEDKSAAAHQIAKVIKVPFREVFQKINTKSPFVYLKRRLNPDEAEQLNALKIKGLILDKDFNRAYPFKEVGAHVIGFCDFDNAAKAGLELAYDRYLQGTPGSTIFLRDAHGNYIPNLDFPITEPVNGHHIETTIDMVYQGILEEEIKNAVLSHKADNGSAVLLNPRTGEVLGMANYPQYDPNRYNEFRIEAYRNRAISDLYEPGSTFKMVAMAMCIEQLQMDMDRELVFCENGRYQLASNTVRDHQRFAYLTARQVFENSSNVGVIKLAEKFSPPLFYRYTRDFGFGAKSGIDLPAEAAGILRTPDNYSRHSVSYMSIGYEVGVTPLQIACAYAAVANEGVLMHPYVVRRVADARGRTVLETRPQVIRQVISRTTARQMKEVLKGVVEHGTGRAARLPGVTIAGKTGTAQKLDKETNSYTSTRHIASFAGFFPVENPRFVLLVVVNNPRNGEYYGSQVAAPVFKVIAQRIIGLAVEDEPLSDKNLAEVVLPGMQETMVALEGLNVANAIALLKDHDLRYELVGQGDLVYRQEPAAYTPLDGSQKIRLFTEIRPVNPPLNMPKVIGLSMKEALRVLSGWNVPVEVVGSGIVVKQVPDAGEKLEKNSKVKLICNPV